MAKNKPGDINSPENVKSRKSFTFEWVAEYENGHLLKQFDEDLGLVHHFGHIDPQRVIKFSIISKSPPHRKATIDLKNGLFSFNEKQVKEIKDGSGMVSIGLEIKDQKIESPWGNKPKLIYVSHVRKDFNMGNGSVNTSILYEIGWEAFIEGKKQKHTIVVDERGRIAIPPKENDGFKQI